MANIGQAFARIGKTLGQIGQCWPKLGRISIPGATVRQLSRSATHYLRSRCLFEPQKFRSCAPICHRTHACSIAVREVPRQAFQDAYRSASPGGPKQAEIEPDLVGVVVIRRFRSKFGRHRPKLGPLRAPDWSVLVEPRLERMWPEFGRLRPVSAPTLPNSTRIRQIWDIR